MSFILTDDHLREHLGHMVEAIGKATLPNMTDHLSVTARRHVEAAHYFVQQIDDDRTTCMHVFTLVDHMHAYLLEVRKLSREGPAPDECKLLIQIVSQIVCDLDGMNEV
jgi:hypothetical protein